MKIAKPLLVVTTPVGVVWGVVEAWRIGPHLAVLMVLLLTVVTIFLGMTVRVIRREGNRGQGTGDRGTAPPDSG